jgi:hypothetical protein
MRKLAPLLALFLSLPAGAAEIGYLAAEALRNLRPYLRVDKPLNVVVVSHDRTLSTADVADDRLALAGFLYQPEAWNDVYPELEKLYARAPFHCIVIA